MIRYPQRVRAGTTSDRMALNLDLAPTVLDLTRAAPQAHFQGKSLMQLVTDPRAEWRTDWLYEYYEFPGNQQVRPCRGVRTERYEYIHYFTQPEEFELYDLETDPQEMHNLYGNPVHAELSQRLSVRLGELRRETGDHYVYQPTVLLKEQTPSSECADLPRHGAKSQ